MQVESTRFGTIQVPDDEVVTFTDGLPGFRGAHKMVLVGAGQLPGAEPGDGHHTLFWLQDLVDPDLAFLTMVPWSAYPDYDIDINPADVAGAESGDVCVLAIVTVRRANDTIELTTNLRAPVVIDTARRIGQQIILQDGDWPVNAPLVEPQPSGVA